MQIDKIDKIIYVHPAKIMRNNRRKIIKEYSDKIDKLSLDTIDYINEITKQTTIRRNSEILEARVSHFAV